MTATQIDAEILAWNVQAVLEASRKWENRRRIAIAAHSGK